MIPGLDQFDHNIFAALHADPFASYNKLSKHVDLAPATVKDRIMKMKENGFLRQDREISDPVLGNRLQTEVIALYDPSRLGLIRLHVLFTGIPNSQALRKAITFCDEHPYTHYRAISFKNPLNLYAQFDIPPSIVTQIKSILEEVRSGLDITELTIMQSNNLQLNHPDFSYWSTYRRDWELITDNKTGESIIDILWQKYLNNQNSDLTVPIHTKEAEEEVYTMSVVDAKLLRELTINAKVSLKFLSNVYDLSSSVLSRYISRLKENVIYRGMLLFDEAFFGMNNLQITFGKFSKHSILDPDTLTDFIKTSPIPLQSTINFNEGYFVIKTLASSILSTEMSKFLWTHSDPAHFNSNQIHAPSTFLYYFYNENYIDRKSWKENDGYIRHEPLRTINL